MPSTIIPFVRCPFCNTVLAVACKEVAEYRRSHKSNRRLFMECDAVDQAVLVTTNGARFPCDHLVYLWGDIRSVEGNWEVSVDWRNQHWPPPSVDTPAEELFWDLVAVGGVSAFSGGRVLARVNQRWWFGKRQFELRVSGVVAMNVSRFIASLDSHAIDASCRRELLSSMVQ